MSSTKTATPSAAPPPDWAAIDGERLHCPLCEYNLRGLTEPRCPECGFTFQWQELIDAERFRHPYLFEHQTKRNIWSFWKTFWRDCQPRRFWRELSPAQPIKLRRLLVYWLISNLFILVAFPDPIILPAIQVARTNALYRALWVPVANGSIYQLQTRYYRGPSGAFLTMTAASFNNQYPPVFSMAFARQVWNQIDIHRSPLPSLLAFLAWTWLTLGSLMIFQVSMRRSGIRNVHLLRCAIYSCDFPLLAAAFILPMLLMTNMGPMLQVTVAAVICPLVVLYRLTFAYSRYLRFDHAFLTALATQVIVALFVFTVGLNLSIY